MTGRGTNYSQSSQVNVSLEKHFDKVIIDLEKNINQRFDSMQVAVNKAEKAADERAEKANEWRKQYNEHAEMFMRKDKFESEHRILQVSLESTNEKVATVSKLVYIGLGVWLILQSVLVFLITRIIDKA